MIMEGLKGVLIRVTPEEIPQRVYFHCRGSNKGDSPAHGISSEESEAPRLLPNWE